MADPSNSQTTVAHSIAVEQLSAARVLADTTRQQLLQTVTDGLPTDGIQKLVNWRLSASHRVPGPFRVKQRTDAQWRDIEVALIAELRAQHTDQQLDIETALILTNARNEPEVLASTAELTGHLEAVTAVFQAHGAAPSNSAPPGQ